MEIKVKYEETVTRESTVSVDEYEFVEWFNEGRDPENQITEFSDLTDAEQAGEIQEFLEDGDESVWARLHDGLDGGYDAHIYEVEVL